jgi:DNA helicase-2/ATP-dependent DNA helicase PcrA
MQNLLENLNKEQLSAVKHTAGPLLIVAGAGTGKTTVITRRIAYLIEQGLAKPDEVLALTFTDKAAGEMQERLDLLLPLGYHDMWIQHSTVFDKEFFRIMDWILGYQQTLS